MKWFSRLPQQQTDLSAIQRINEECSKEGNSDSGYCSFRSYESTSAFSFSIERQVIKSLLTLMMLTSYDKFDFYHYKAIQKGDASVLVVGARCQGVFADVRLQSTEIQSPNFPEPSMVYPIKTDTKVRVAEQIVQNRSILRKSPQTPKSGALYRRPKASLRCQTDLRSDLSSKSRLFAVCFCPRKSSCDQKGVVLA